MGPQVNFYISFSTKARRSAFTATEHQAGTIQSDLSSLDVLSYHRAFAHAILFILTILPYLLLHCLVSAAIPLIPQLNAQTEPCFCIPEYCSH